MITPIYDAVREYCEQQPARLHMPGHKGTLQPLPFAFDVTELPQTGNLFDEDGVFVQSERLAAAVYGAGGAAYSAGGSTLCIQAMMSALLCGKRTVALQRRCHKSAATAAAVLGLQPVWLYADEPEELLNELTQKLPQCDGVLLTSPDYFGCVLPLDRVSAMCKKQGAALLVDAAHGAHYPVSGLPDPIAQGADAACVSLHKTLPALTGSAMVLTREEELAGRIKHEMTRFGSSSPSFLILLSGERAALSLPQTRQSWQKLIALCENLRQKHRCLLENDDPTKLWLGLDDSCRDLVSSLLAKYRLSPELYDETQLLFMLTPHNCDEELQRIDAFLSEMDAYGRTRPGTGPIPRPRQILAPQQAFCAQKQRVPLQQAEGRVCAEVANVCPPCACLLCYGEEIDAESVNFLKTYGILCVDVVK
ncbi:MAG: DegT/DnrJ/EryC1/StrS family aminotransferase [Clostridia bacterium]|nr:DegT/DnrJ/EryC1/StrS family aminotransferase [Clostridia bacterium]